MIVVVVINKADQAIVVEINVVFNKVTVHRIHKVHVAINLIITRTAIRIIRIGLSKVKTDLHKALIIDHRKVQTIDLHKVQILDRLRGLIIDLRKVREQTILAILIMQIGHLKVKTDLRKAVIIDLRKVHLTLQLVKNQARHSFPY
jgi:hypothetical protein